MFIDGSANWQEYRLLDCGNGRKLEQFGEYVLDRPDPRVLWKPSLSAKDWRKRTHAAFQSAGKNKGEWNFHKKIPDHWKIRYRSDHLDLTFRLSLTSFKHVGIFPEQAVNWEFIAERVRKMTRPKVLVLFAYTGGASLAAKYAGADVVHVESLKQLVGWSRKNMELSGLKDIRWTVEDAFKFVKRENKRGNKYQGIVLDPPAFGRGPKGETWKLDEELEGLTQASMELLDPKESFYLINAYASGLSPLSLRNIIKTYRPPETLKTGEFYLPAESGSQMPAGAFGSFYY